MNRGSAPKEDVFYNTCCLKCVSVSCVCMITSTHLTFRHIYNTQGKKAKKMIKSHLSSIQIELVQMWQYVKQISNIYDAVTTS